MQTFELLQKLILPFPYRFPPYFTRTQHAEGSCLGHFLGPSCSTQVGLAHLHNLLAILPSGKLTQMQCGEPFDLVIDASFLFLFDSSSFLKLGSGLTLISFYLGMNVLEGFATEISPDSGNSSQNIFSTRWVSACSKRDRFAAIVIGLRLEGPFTHR